MLLVSCKNEEEKNIKFAKEVESCYNKWKPIRQTTDFTAKSLKAIRAWNNVLQVLKENNCQSTLIYVQGYHLELKNNQRYVKLSINRGNS